MRYPAMQDHHISSSRHGQLFDKMARLRYSVAVTRKGKTVEDIRRLDGDVVDVTHVAGSASTVSTARSTTAYLGECDHCHRPVRADLSEDKGKLTVIECPDCGKELAGERLAAVTTTLVCDASCRSAYRKDCKCSCGGVNHARLWSVRISSEELPESEVLEQLEGLVRYYNNQVAALQRLQEKQEAETRERAKAFNAWIEVEAHEALVFDILASDDPALQGIKDQIDNNEIPGDFAIRIARDNLAREKRRRALDVEADWERE